jgi:hypothetical protein
LLYFVALIFSMTMRSISSPDEGSGSCNGQHRNRPIHETMYRDLRMPKTERGRKGVRGVLYIAECKLGHEKERGEEEVVIYRWLGE